LSEQWNTGSFLVRLTPVPLNVVALVRWSITMTAPAPMAPDPGSKNRTRPHGAVLAQPTGVNVQSLTSAFPWTLPNRPWRRTAVLAAAVEGAASAGTTAAPSITTRIRR
jgi:hypothetical protein